LCTCYEFKKSRSMFAIVKEKRVRLRMTDQETEESDRQKKRRVPL